MVLDITLSPKKFDWYPTIEYSVCANGALNYVSTRHSAIMLKGREILVLLKIHSNPGIVKLIVAFISW